MKVEVLEESWTRFAKSLIETKEAWEVHKELCEGFGSRDIEMLRPEVGKFVSKSFNKSKFDVLLPRLVDYWRTIGGVEELIPRPKKKSEKELQKKIEKRIQKGGK